MGRAGRSRSSSLGRLAIVLVLLGVVALGYALFSKVRVTSPATLASEANPPARPAAAFRCDGRKYCSQMTSCAEATFFLKNCPGVEMDGDHDGVPCEQQWCK